MTDLSEALRADVREAVAEALAQHQPEYAVSRDEAARRLGCSPATISTLLRKRVLSYVPHTHSIPVGQLRRLGEMDEYPNQPTPVDLSAVDAA